MKVVVKVVRIVGIVSVNNMRETDMEYEIMKRALFKACKYLRELVGANNYIMPWTSEPVINDIDLNGITWMCYFLDEAEKEIEALDDEKIS